jgi:RND family efflux transporter MFP subunit
MHKSLFRNLGRLAVAGLTALLAGCDRSAETADHPTQAVRQVEVIRPGRHNVQRSVGEPGQLVAFETTPIHAKIAGYVRTVNVDIGDPIKKGQLLAVLSVPEVEADLGEKKAAVDEAVAKQAQAVSRVKVAEAAVTSAIAKVGEVRAGIKRADADVVRWQHEYRRVEQLYNERAQTGTLLDETRNKLSSAEASVDEAHAKVESADAALTEARSELEKARADVAAAAASIDVARSQARHAEAMAGYARIEAPYDGIITERHVDTGHLTRPGADSAPLFVTARTDILTTVVHVPDTFSTDVNPGDPATVKIEALKGRTIEGKVTRTSWALDPKTRTLRTEIDIPNPGGKLPPGLYAYATVIVDEHNDVLTIPAKAVMQEQGQAFCVVVADGKATRRPVQLGLSDGTRTEIVRGLDGSEQVVKTFAASLTDGQAVSVQKATAK